MKIVTLVANCNNIIQKKNWKWENMKILNYAQLCGKFWSMHVLRTLYSVNRKHWEGFRIASRRVKIVALTISYSHPLTAHSNTQHKQRYWVRYWVFFLIKIFGAGNKASSLFLIYFSHWLRHAKCQKLNDCAHIVICILET